MEFRINLTTVNGKVNWEVRSYDKRLMTPDRQIAKGESIDGREARKAADKAIAKYREANNV